MIYKAKFTIEVTIGFFLAGDGEDAHRWIDFKGCQSEYIAKAIETLRYPGEIEAKTIKTEHLF